MPYLNLLSLRAGQALTGQKPSALLWCRMAAHAWPQESGTWFDLGLAYKRSGNWLASQKANEAATAIDGGNAGAWWNLGIAATAREDWRMARHAWRNYGLQVPDGSGPLHMPLGMIPLRLNPAGNAEVVWAERLDPARACVLSVPLPASGFRHGDTLLHDGYPAGQRLYKGQLMPVFNALQLLVKSPFSTFHATLHKARHDTLSDLERHAEGHNLIVQNWTTETRLLSRDDSETIAPNYPPSQPAEVAELGIASRSQDAVAAFLEALAAAQEGREVTAWHLALAGAQVKA